MEDIILVGGGGHCKSVIDTIKNSNEYNIVGILDLPDKIDQEILGIKVIGTDEKMEYYYKAGITNAFLTIGSIGDIRLRKSLYLTALDIGYKFPNIIDSTAIVSNNTKMGHGNFIGKGSIINSDTTIGDNCIINTGVIIEHDCCIQAFCHIAPGATISGGVIIGENTHIGTNATVIQNRKIGCNTIIGGGSVVINDIGDSIKAYGNPCKGVEM